MGLTSERLLDIATINSFDNFNKLPLFVTATCEFSRYDDPGRTSAGELCLLNPRGGAIALLTTCRLAYSATNDILNAVLIDKLFKRMQGGKYPTLGDAIRMTKSSPQLGGTQAYYFANFHLLGDPGLTLCYPQHKVTVTKINNKQVNGVRIDTLGVMARISVEGYVADTAGSQLNGFNGVIYSSVFDRQQDIQCLLNDPASFDGIQGNPFRFKLQRNRMFRGKTEVVNGKFNFSFLVPLDIGFNTGPGKMSFYASNGTEDASGIYDLLVVGGASTNSVTDTEGPRVKLYMNDKNFADGGITNELPVFYADLIDSSGINTLGTSFGHDISAVLNKAGSKSIILNDYYEAGLNSYQSGRIRYPFEKLKEGDYQLNFKVWDRRYVHGGDARLRNDRCDYRESRRGPARPNGDACVLRLQHGRLLRPLAENGARARPRAEDLPGELVPTRRERQVHLAGVRREHARASVDSTSLSGRSRRSPDAARNHAALRRPELDGARIEAHAGAIRRARGH